MSLMDDFDAGHKAYYDEVPSYKNPYADSPHFDDSNFKAWERGWFAASNEHRTFTENQDLKNELEEWKTTAMALESSNRNLLSITIADNNMIIAYRDFVNKRDDQLNALLEQVRKMNKFTFSREKMVKVLDSMIKMNYGQFELKSPEVKKNNPK